MRELLIRYLLGELEPHEHDAVQQQLAESPELRRELAHLRSCFAASCPADEDPDEPPRGLAERTAVRVSESGTHSVVPADGSTSKSAALADACDPPAGVLGWSLADLTVAGGVILAVSMLLFPAVRESRDGTRRTICMNNQRELGGLIQLYALDRKGYIPEVQPNENAGIYTVRLVELGYISPQDLALLLICPDAPLANELKTKQLRIVIPSQKALDRMSDDQLAKVRPWMSPTYAYGLGFRVGHQYYYIQNKQTNTPVLCDAPSEDGSMSPNHGGKLVQALYTDGHVRRLTSCEIAGVDTDMFRNAIGEVAAGLWKHDAVLGRSEATPRFLDRELQR
jgi:prepilin-type processing-associated H-X9-DG protein